MSASTTGDRAIHLIVFSHLDLTFMGSHEECLSRGNKVLARALALLDQHEDFRFLVEYALFMRNYLDCHPTERERVSRHVRSGRLQIGLEWSGIYQASEEEENLIRNLTLAKRYLERDLGGSGRTIQLTDLPSFTPQMPQVLSKCGIDFCVITRAGPADHPLFVWKAPDGSEVLTCYTHGYNEAARLGLQRDFESIDRPALEREVSERLSAGPMVVHWGSDMYLPAPKLPQTVHRWNASGSTPVRLDTLETLRAALQGRTNLPALQGDMPSVWPYVLAAHADVTSLDGRANAWVSQAERLATLAWLLGEPYPEAEIGSAWETLLFARDHNFSGKGAAEGQRRKLADRLRAMTAGEEIARSALARIAERVQAPEQSVPIVVFNGHLWPVSGPVTAHVTLYPHETGERGLLDIFGDRELFASQRLPVLRDCEGRSVAYQLVEDKRSTLGEMTIVFEASAVPSLGYTTYRLEPGEEAARAPLCQLTRPSWFRASTGRILIGSHGIQVEVDERSGELHLRDAESGKNLLASVVPIGIEEAHIEALREAPPRGLSQDFPEREVRRRFEPDRVEVTEHGPVRTCLRISGTVLSRPVVETISIYPDDHVDIDLRITWDRSQWGRIELQCLTPDRGGDPASTPGQTAVEYGVPFGRSAWNETLAGAGPSPLRPDEASPATWAGMRIAQKWLRFESPAGPVTIATQHRLWRQNGEGLQAVLVRGGRMAGSFATTCEIDFSFSIFVGSGAGRAPHRLGAAAAMPLLAHVVNDTSSRKTLPPSRSCVSAEGAEVVMTAFKPADSRDRLILRIFEATGKEGKLKVSFAPELGVDAEGRACSLCEEPTSPQTDSFAVSAWEIATLAFGRKTGR